MRKGMTSGFSNTFQYMLKKEKLDLDIHYDKFKVFTEKYSETLANRYTNLILHVLKKLHKQNKTYPEIKAAIMAIPSHYADCASVGIRLDERQKLHENCTEAFCEFKKLKSVNEQKDFVPKNGKFPLDGDFAKHDVLEQVINIFKGASLCSKSHDMYLFPYSEY